MDALEAEAPGLMGALEWAHDHARHVDLLRLASALLRAWDTRGRRAEELRMYTWAEQAAGSLGDPTWQNWAAHQLAWTYGRMGRMEESRAGYQRALDLARQVGDRDAERAEVHGLAVQDFQTGRVEEARAGYQRALDLAVQLGDPAAEAVELVNFGLFLYEQGEIERGRPMIEESLAISERLSDVYAAGKCHEFLAHVERRAGNTAAAIAHYRQALARFEQVQSPDAADVRRWLRDLGAQP